MAMDAIDYYKGILKCLGRKLKTTYPYDGLFLFLSTLKPTVAVPQKIKLTYLDT